MIFFESFLNYYLYNCLVINTMILRKKYCEINIFTNVIYSIL